VRTFSALSAFGIVLSSALVAACGSSDTEIRSEPLSPYEAYIAHLVELLCSSAADCCSNPGFSESMCQQYLPLLAERPDAQNFVFHEDLGAQCIEATRAGTACAEPPAICNSVVTGLVAPGQPCRSTLECAAPSPLVLSGSCDELDDGSFRCRQAAKLGEACDGSCDRNLCLDLTSFTGTRMCHKEEGLTCGESLTCEAVAPLGGSCADSPACATGSHCDFDSKTCLTDGGPGAPCFFQTECGDGTSCNGSSCVAHLPIGAACNPDVDTCANGSCQSGTCAVTGFVCALFGGA
jgi:hypothetical protein